MPILNLKNKREKLVVNGDSIHEYFGWVAGTLNSYNNNVLSAQRALDDIKDIVNEWNNKNGHNL